MEALKKIRNLSFLDLYFFIILSALLIFGFKFTKFHVMGPFYLYDLVLIGLFCLVFFKNIYLGKFHLDKFFVFLSLLHIFYLLFAFAISEAPLSIVLRQFAIGGYFIIAGVIFAGLFNSQKKIGDYFNIVLFIARTALYIQVFYLLYLGIVKKQSFWFAFTKHYFSSAVLPLLVIVFTDLFVNKNISWKRKVTEFLLLILAAYGCGHSSLFLSFIFVFMLYFFTTTSKRNQIIFFLISILLLLSLRLFIPEFKNGNANHRYYYWSYNLERMVKEKVCLIGYGYGTPYVSRDDKEEFDYLIRRYSYFKSSVGGRDVKTKPEIGQYIHSMHNSLLNWCFHIGLLPGMILFLPIFLFFINGKYREDMIKQSIFINLLGLFVYSSINVILELPHSSIIIWLFYFLLIYSGYTKKILNYN